MNRNELYMRYDNKPINIYYGLFLGLLFVAAIVITFLFVPRQGKFRYEFQKGKPWMHETLYAPFSFAINKPEAEIKAETDSLLATQNPYFQIDNTIGKEKTREFAIYFNKTWAQFHRNADPIPPADDVRKNYIQLIERIYKQGILEQSIEFYPELKNKSALTKISGNFAQEISIQDIYSLKSAYEKILSTCSLRDGEMLYGPSAFCKSLKLNQFITANLFFDKNRTDLATQETMSSLSLTQGMIQAGERVISKGDLVMQDSFEVLESLRTAYEKGRGENTNLHLIAAGQISFVTIVFFILFLYLYHFRKDYLVKKRRILCLLLSVVGWIVICSFIIQTNIISLYTVPIVILAIIIRTFFDSRTAIFTMIATLLLIGFFAPNGFEFILVQMIASFVAIVSLQKLHRRAHLIYTALFITLSYGLIYFSLSLMHEGNLQTIDYSNFKWFAINGILILIAYPLIYVFEKVFGFVSDVTLLELSDTNHPLLRKLAENAPGTFQHSIQVANLAEEAILQLGGNPMLVRAGALYHDIGKSENAQFFTENQLSGENPHNELSEKESAQVIIDHVTAGENIARKNNLPESIIDFIVSHHGTSKTGYFYTQYVNKHPDEDVDPTDFTYPGPVPTSKEVAVVMLADSLEAASRSLSEKNEESLRSLIDNIFKIKMNEGQLANSELTFHDISALKEIYFQKLKNIYHVRIKYPKLKQK
ncbi:HDIG domain-containing protein [Puteibacter caeruleilacunae]|nr:HDIG domain-containing protein [Puteibacter caeruleilacunae]